jgi:predicted ATP-dependent protease
VLVRNATAFLLELQPVFEGVPVHVEQFESLKAQGRVGEEQYAAWRNARRTLAPIEERMQARAGEIRREVKRAVRAVYEETARQLLLERTAAIARDFPGEGVREFLAQVEEDVLDRVDQPEAVEDTQLYGVNVLLCRAPNEPNPVVIEHVPTVHKLLGTVERECTPTGPSVPGYRSVRAGSLLQADGGYLVLDARDVLYEQGAWKALVRALRSGFLEIAPGENSGPAEGVKPEPIPLRVRVIMIGDHDTYYRLDEEDPDFANLF